MLTENIWENSLFDEKRKMQQLTVHRNKRKKKWISVAECSFKTLHFCVFWISYIFSRNQRKNNVNFKKKSSYIDIVIEGTVLKKLACMIELLRIYISCLFGSSLKRGLSLLCTHNQYFINLFFPLYLLHFSRSVTWSFRIKTSLMITWYH